MAFTEGLKNISWINVCGYTLRYKIPCILMGERKWDEIETKRRFKIIFGRSIDLKNPKTLNEKIQWLKLYDHKDFHTVCADKLAVRDYWKKFGEEGLIPLLFHTENWKDIRPENIPDIPCIVKCNSGSASYQIIRNKKDADFKQLQGNCRKWLQRNYYYCSQEWQYKNIKPCILVEKLLLDEKGCIPNDYKLHFINGELQFVYCSIDREGKNYRSIYSPDWRRLDMQWMPKGKSGVKQGDDISAPETFEKMKEIGSLIAKQFKYVRVDFYDVQGKLYYGEITLHHGSGYDVFVPDSYDLYYGNLLKL